MPYLVGHIKKTLSYLLENNFHPKQWGNVKEVRARIESGHGINKEISAGDKVTLQNVINTLNQAVPSEAILLSDVGEHKMEIAKNFQPKTPSQLIISNGFASMGLAIPGGIAAKLAKPNKPVICVTGDGGFLMNVAELETIHRLNLPLIMIVLSDGAFGLEKQMMRQKHLGDYGVYFTNPDFSTLAKSFGIKAIRLNNLQEIEKYINMAIEQKEIFLIDIPLNNN
jgi:acetolactate synthase-1/2/3 large subunit